MRLFWRSPIRPTELQLGSINFSANMDEDALQRCLCARVNNYLFTLNFPNLQKFNEDPSSQ